VQYSRPDDFPFVQQGLPKNRVSDTFKKMF
jgi:hypothetical protein